VGEQEVRRAGEGCSSGFRPGKDEDECVAAKFLEGEIPLLAAAHEAFKEVFAALGHGEAFLEHAAGVLAYAGEIGAAAEIAEEDLDEPAEAEVAHGGDGHAPFDGAEEELDPGVVLGAFEAAEGLAEDEAAGDVEGGPVVPFLHVDGLVAAVRLFVDALEEEVDELDDGALLLPHRCVGESIWGCERLNCIHREAKRGR